MTIRIAVIFERRNVNYDGVNHNVFKAVDLDAGMYGLNYNDEWLFARLSKYHTLFVINKENIYQHLDVFKTYNYFAHLIKEKDFFDTYHINENYTFY